MTLTTSINACLYLGLRSFFLIKILYFTKVFAIGRKSLPGYFVRKDKTPELQQFIALK